MTMTGDEDPRESRFARMARERQADRAAGRPERGLFTGRGRRSRAAADRDEAIAQPAAAEDAVADETRRRDAWEEDDQPARPQTGMKRSVMRAIRQIPSYLRLMFGLLLDGRVSKVDRLLVVAAVAYMVSPLDFIPDLIPFLGEVDDVYLLVVALQRLLENAGRRVLLDHWRGDPEALEATSLSTLLRAAGFFLPARLRRRLRRMAGRR
ncbi:MAG: DUF1232 domain-containing protein [Gemmatimonadota bacterium]|nr:DUF1232 domain-containing protein [Gemmatimonadota bacterium]